MNVQISKPPGHNRRYTFTMFRLLVILIALSLVAMPLRVFLLDACDCSVQYSFSTADSDQQGAQSSCCSVETQQNDSQAPPHNNNNENSSCDGCDCPLMCCGTITMATVSIKTKNFPPQLGSEHLGPAHMMIHATPHISRLIRPPKPLIIAL